MLYGYCRISTPRQNIERQIRNITNEFPKAKIISETYTGTKQERPEWKKLKKKLKSGDIVVFDSVSRMSRNAADGWSEYLELFNRNVELIFLKEPTINTRVFSELLARKIDGTSINDEFAEEVIKGINNGFLKLAEQQIKLAFLQSEKEVLDLQQRTREGIETARQNGKQIGRPAGGRNHVNKFDNSIEKMRKYSRRFGGTLNDKETIKLCGINKNTFYKYLHVLEDENYEINCAV